MARRSRPLRQQLPVQKKTKKRSMRWRNVSASTSPEEVDEVEDDDDPKTRIFEEVTLTASPGVVPMHSSLAPAAFAVGASRVVNPSGRGHD